MLLLCEVSIELRQEVGNSIKDLGMEKYHLSSDKIILGEMMSRTFITKRNTDILSEAKENSLTNNISYRLTFTLKSNLFIYDTYTLYFCIVTYMVIEFVPCVDMLEEEIKII